MGGVARKVKKVAKSIVNEVKRFVKRVVDEIERVVKSIRKNLAVLLVVIAVILIFVAALVLMMGPAFLAAVQTIAVSLSPALAGIGAGGLFLMGFGALGLAFIIDSEAAGDTLRKVGGAISDAAGGLAEIAGDIVGSVIGGVANSSAGRMAIGVGLAIAGFFGLKALAGGKDEQPEVIVNTKSEEEEDSNESG